MRGESYRHLAPSKLRKVSRVHLIHLRQRDTQWYIAHLVLGILVLLHHQPLLLLLLKLRQSLLLLHLLRKGGVICVCNG